MSSGDQDKYTFFIQGSRSNPDIDVNTLISFKKFANNMANVIKKHLHNQSSYCFLNLTGIFWKILSFLEVISDQMYL